MAYGLFDQEDNHVYTYEYGHAKAIAEKMAKVLGEGFYVRELTADEYWARMKEIYQTDKYKTKNV